MWSLPSQPNLLDESRSMRDALSNKQNKKQTDTTKQTSKKEWAGEAAWQVTAFAATPVNLNLICRITRWEERTDSCKLSSAPHTPHRCFKKQIKQTSTRKLASR